MRDNTKDMEDMLYEVIGLVERAEDLLREARRIRDMLVDAEMEEE